LLICLALFSELNNRLILKIFYTSNLVLKNASTILLWFIYHVIVRINLKWLHYGIRYMSFLNPEDLRLIPFERSYLVFLAK